MAEFIPATFSECLKQLDQEQLGSTRKEAKKQIAFLGGSDASGRCWLIVVMRALALILLPMGFGCASFERADLLDGELFVSEGHKHVVSLDSDEIYSFRIKFGANMQVYDAVAEQNFKTQNRMRLHRLRESE